MNATKHVPEPFRLGYASRCATRGTADGPLHLVSGEGRRDGLPDAFDGVTPAFQVGAFIDLETRGLALRRLCAPFAILLLPVLETLRRVK